MFKSNFAYTHRFYKQFNKLEMVQHIDIEVNYYRIMEESNNNICVHRYARATQSYSPLRSVYLSGPYKQYIDALGQRKSTNE